MKTLLSIILIALAARAQTSTVIVVKATLRDAANAVATQEFDPVGGEFTFTAGLVTPPGTNITHYWCATPFNATNRAKLNVLTNTPPFSGNVLVMDYDLTADPDAPRLFLSTNGLAVYTPPLFTAP